MSLSTTECFHAGTVLEGIEYYKEHSNCHVTVLHVCCTGTPEVGNSTNSDTFLSESVIEKSTDSDTFSCKSLTLPPATETKSNSDFEQVRKTKYKQHWCLFCKKLVTAIARHTRLMHYDKEEVKAILLESSFGERQRLLRNLRLQGDNEYNMTHTNKIFVRVPKHSERQRSGTFCPKCGGLFGKTDVSRHRRRCTGQHITEETDTIETEYTHLKQWIQEFLDPLQNDHVSQVIKSDFCLSLLSKHYVERLRNSLIDPESARQILRRLGRLLLQVRKIEPSVLTYEDCLTPENYLILIEGIVMLWKGRPSVPLTLNGAIKQMVQVLKVYYTKSVVHQDRLVALDKFLAIHISEYREQISKQAGLAVLELSEEGNDDSVENTINVINDEFLMKFEIDDEVETEVSIKVEEAQAETEFDVKADIGTDIKIRAETEDRADNKVVTKVDCIDYPPSATSTASPGNLLTFLPIKSVSNLKINYLVQLVLSIGI